MAFSIDPNVPVLKVHAAQGKRTRAEPVAALAEQHRIHHVGFFAELEDELCAFVAGDKSPDHLDAHVWGIHALMLGDEMPIVGQMLDPDMMGGTHRSRWRMPS